MVFTRNYPVVEAGANRLGVVTQELVEEQFGDREG
jgi:hypothetical protein